MGACLALMNAALPLMGASLALVDVGEFLGSRLRGSWSHPLRLRTRPENFGRVHVAVYNFENFTASLMSGSEILGASMWRPKFFENFTAALMSGSEIFLSAQWCISGAHELGLAGHGRVSGARGRG